MYSSAYYEHMRLQGYTHTWCGVPCKIVGKMLHFETRKRRISALPQRGTMGYGEILPIEREIEKQKRVEQGEVA